jgi:hypothetical protein
MERAVRRRLKFEGRQWKVTKVAFVVFDGMAALDLVGVYDPVTRLKSMG